MTWEERQARLLALAELAEHDGDPQSAADIRAALERDKQYELLRAAVNDTGPCTDDQHGDECACNADVMLRKLRQRVEELEREVDDAALTAAQHYKRAEAAEAKLAKVATWCRYAPDQWVMRKDVLCVLAAAKGE